MLRDILLVYLFIAVIITAHCATFVMPWSKGGYKKRFSFVCFAATLYLFGYLLELVNVRLEDKLFWNIIAYIGMAYAAALWCATVILYVNRDLRLSQKLAALIFVIPLLTVLFRLNDSWLHLIFKSYAVEAEYSGTNYPTCPGTGNRYSGLKETNIPVLETV